MNGLDTINLKPLMALSRGSPDVRVALIDGPVAMTHPDLATANIEVIAGTAQHSCQRPESAACVHGTFIAGILSGLRERRAPAICPQCTLLLRPIFSEAAAAEGSAMPWATAAELAAALIDSVAAGARLINLSVGIKRPSAEGERDLKNAFEHAARHGASVVAAAGNHGAIGSTAITRHANVISAVASDHHGRPSSESNLGRSIGLRGLCVPTDTITSLATDGEVTTMGGTSAAAPFITGTMALLWSLFPDASPGDLAQAVTRPRSAHPRRVVPPLLDAWASYQILLHNRE